MTARTEGWPVGLYLAALIARDSGGDVVGVSGEDRYVADYLYRESLASSPSDPAVPAPHRGARSALRPAVRRACSRGSSAQSAAARPRGDERVPGPARPAARVVPLPRAVPRVPARRAAPGRARRRSRSCTCAPPTGTSRTARRRWRSSTCCDTDRAGPMRPAGDRVDPARPTRPGRCRPCSGGSRRSATPASRPIRRWRCWPAGSRR